MLEEKLNSENKPENDDDNHPETEPVKPEKNALTSGSAVKQSMNNEHNSEN